MNSTVALGISSAVVCGLWSALSNQIGLLGWAGFAGCTTYFACGEHGVEGIKKAISTNLVGVICAIAIILLSEGIPLLGDLGIWCGLLTFVMCFVSKYEPINFCVGMFVGCFSTFASQGNWTGLILSLMLGSLVGASCDFGSVWLKKITNKH